MRHISFNGKLRDYSVNGISIEADRGLRIGQHYQLEILSDIETVVLEALVRWCRLHSVRPGAIAGDFEPLFLAGLELTSSRPGPPVATLLSTSPRTTTKRRVDAQVTATIPETESAGRAADCW